MGKWCRHASSLIFDQIIIKVAGNQDRNKSSDEYDFGPNQTTLLELLAREWRKLHTLNLNISEASWPILIKFYV